MRAARVLRAVALGVVCGLALAGCQTSAGLYAPTGLQNAAIEVTALPPVPQAEVVPPAPPPVVKSAGHIACDKRGGSFVSIGSSGAMTCQTPTADGGKQCRRESDCDSVCLARSRTCAPIKPVLGCQAVLQNDGRRVDLCIE
jgi:hypothetical protein